MHTIFLIADTTMGISLLHIPYSLDVLFFFFLPPTLSSDFLTFPVASNSVQVHKSGGLVKDRDRREQRW